MPPELILFDCDGVLVDSEEISNRVVVESLARYGLSLSFEAAMDAFVGGTMRGAAVKAREMGADLPENWVDEVYAETYEALAAAVEPVAGVPELLRDLDAKGQRYCVVSNGSQEKMRITLGRTGLLPHVEGRMFSAHDLGTAKPDPALYLHAAAAFGVAPASCLVVEDSATGAEAAERAGMPCLAYVPHGDGAKLTKFGAKPIKRMLEVGWYLSAE